MAKQENCETTITICLNSDNNEAVQTYQTYVRSREKKLNFNKSQTINRIIKEWAEDRSLTLDVAKRK